MTTRRRNMALAERKRLKEAGELVSGYVAFPAKLMVKKHGDKEYKLHTDFSRSKVEWWDRLNFTFIALLLLDLFDSENFACHY